MIKFIQNIGDFFSSNYFDEDFLKKVQAKSGYSLDDQKALQKKISPLKDQYYRYKQNYIEGRLRIKDKIYETHEFHTILLDALGYNGSKHQYDEHFHFNDKEVLPVRHKLYRGDQLHLLILEMQSLIKEADEEPDGLFEQRYHIDNEADELTAREQRYHRSQWSRVFTISEELKISPVIINKAISELCLLEQNERPQYIMLLAGNKIFLVEVEKWFRGSYLLLDIEELFTEATIERKYYTLFYLLLSKEMLAPDSEMVLMDQLDEDSHKSAYEVTKDLKEGIIHAVEALANEALYYKKEIQQEDFDETNDQFESEVKDDCLSIVYRLLFVFYAESRADLDILPISDSVYQKGYSLEMLRDLEQTQLIMEHSRNGYFFHESLRQLFGLMSSGYREKENGLNKSFRIRHIDSPLFDDRKLKQLRDVQFRNFIWQDVICQLSLSKKQKKKARGRISYANLGINQLGSVYESLLAYRGFYAEEDYIEVHPKKKPKEGTLLVQRRRRDDFLEDEVLKDSDDKEVIIPKGQFVYRLSGRDRQKSASYYTPEVLTKCTVKYTLKGILEKVEQGEMKALELLDLKLLEPAMGAAAFHNELINQLAEAYLSFRQKELKKKISPEKFREELQKVKAYIATNNAYGVDINPTAIELGKLSLWLNVIHKDMETPFFANRLAVGNAVVGAWFKVYTKAQTKKKWWEEAPKLLQLGPEGKKRTKNEIYHFLLPDKGMVPSAGIKLLKKEFPDHAKRVTDWRKAAIKPITEAEFLQLQKICDQIDTLLEEYYLFQKKLNAETKNKLDIWGGVQDEEQAKLKLRSYDEKEQLNDQRLRQSAPYYKLKMVMDYWCSLWFWDMRNAEQLPTRQQYINDIQSILNIDLESSQDLAPKLEQLSLDVSAHIGTQAQLQIIEKTQQSDLFDSKARFEEVKLLSQQHRFFHNQLEFMEVFKERGGFDVIVGNPPWVVVSYDREGLLTDGDPLPIIQNYETVEMDNHILSLAQANKIFKHSFIYHLNEIEGYKSFFNGKTNYKLLNGQKPNLHKLVLENALNLGCHIGIVHDKGVFDDSKGQLMRRHLYKRIKYYFQFQNELKLFQDVGNTKKFDVTVYGVDKQIGFTSINNIFHPVTVDQAFINKNNELIGIRDENGKWNLKGNATRKLFINEAILKFYKNMLQDGAPWDCTKLPVIHSNLLLESLIKIDSIASKLQNFEKEVESTIMLDETKGKRDGIIIKKPVFVESDQFVLASIHYYDGNPLFQTPNENCSSHRDNSRVDLLTISKDYLPRTVYKLIKDNDIEIPYPGNYYYAQRKRAQISNERTLITSIQPAGRVHTDNTYSIHFADEFKMLAFASYSFSIIYDFYVKSTGRENIYFDTVSNLPLFEVPCKYILSRSMHLTCLTSYYERLWNAYKVNLPEDDCFSLNHPLLNSMKFSDSKNSWDFEVGFKSEFIRRQALLEIDVLTSMHIGLSLDELITIYSVVFGVLQSNEEKKLFDNNGRLIPAKLRSNLINGMTAEENGIIYEGPVYKVDRVEDYTVAWKHFEKVFNEKEAEAT